MSLFYVDKVKILLINSINKILIQSVKKSTPMAEIKIRKISYEDKDQFIDVYIRAYQSLSDYKYTSKGEVKNYFKWLYKRDNQGFLVAEKDGKAVGFIAGDGNWIDQEGERVLEIHELFVLPEERRKGVGSMLLKEILEYGKKRGLKKVELWVGKTNYQAICFYKKFGFKEVGTWGKWLRMVRSLNY